MAGGARAGSVDSTCTNGGFIADSSLMATVFFCVYASFTLVSTSNCDGGGAAGGEQVHSEDSVSQIQGKVGGRSRFYKWVVLSIELVNFAAFLGTI